MWDQAQWINPPVVFRGAPLWSWNSEIDPARLAGQIEAMHEGGMGGFFVHPRYGMETLYLSQEYFDAVQVSYDKARALGMNAYLYDEDRWPSGTAGGLITRDKPEFQARFLVCQRGDVAPTPEAPVVARYAAQFGADGAPVSWNRLPMDAAPGEAALTFVIRRRDPYGFFNDGTYVDVMNPKATAAFLESTHEQYAQRWGNDFGTFIPATFTDEPNYCMVSFRGFAEGPFVPWTDRLPEEFKARRGYDILDFLPELYYEAKCGPFSKVRYDYYRTASELFVESYSKPIGEWCTAHNIAASGHMLAEESLEKQLRAVGSCMPHYEHMQWPGIDLLSDQCDELLTAKQCTSVADQLARPRVLTETYGCTGWDWPLEGHKFTGDWQLVTGVNFRCHHLVHYSIAGEGKRDCPASLSPHSPWWPHYKSVEDYFARLSWALTRGRPIRDVLVIHPIETAWGQFLRAMIDKPSIIREMDAHLRALIYGLSNAHHDWDFADESLLAKYGSVESNAVVVGQMSYRVILVPDLKTLRASTVTLIERFQKAGGTVIFCGEGPDCIEGAADARAKAWTSKAINTADAAAAVAAVDRLLPRRVSIRENNAEFSRCWSMLRDVAPGRLLFIQSHDRKAPHTLDIEVEGQLPVILHDPMTGRQRQLNVAARNGRVVFTLDLPATGSALLSFGLPISGALAPVPLKDAQSVPLDGPYKIELSEPNVLPLDFGRFRVLPGDEPSPLLPIAKGDQLLRDRLNLGPRATWSDIQPYARKPDPKVYAECEAVFTFHVSAIPSQCALAIEESGIFTVEVNGRVAPKASGWWIDPDIHTVDITSLLRPGENTLRLTFGYRRHFHMEDFHLVGNFGVAPRTPGAITPGNLTLVPPPAQLNTGDWITQGLPFYGAIVRYHTTFTVPAGKRASIALPQIHCTSAAVIVNGKRFILPWAPFEAEVTDALRAGENDLVIEVASGRRNSLGPIHTTWGPYTLPAHFDPTDPTWTDAYQLTPHALGAAPVVRIE